MDGRIAEIDASLAALDQRDLALRHEYAALRARRADLIRQRAELLAALHRQHVAPQPRAVVMRVPVPRPPEPQPAPEPAPRRGPEASTRSVQNALLILGGLLLAVAAVVFTAVAWATFGLGGRAAILGGATLLALATPVVLARRGLVATAETIAAVGLLMVTLDGYAAWTVGLTGGVRATTFAAAVLALTAALATGYRVLTDLSAPRFAALVAVQPVLPLLVFDRGIGPAGWSATYLSVAVLNLAALRLASGDRADGAARWLLRGLAGGLHALALLAALCSAGAGLVLATTPADGARCAASLVLVAATGVGTARAVGHPLALAVAHGAAAVAVIVAGARVLGLWRPGWSLVGAAAVATVVAVGVRALPRGARRGADLAGVWSAGLLGALTAVLALRGAGRAFAANVPIWAADLTRWPLHAPYRWQVPAALALLTVGAMALLPRGARHAAAVTGLVLVSVAVPGAFGMPWWAPAAVAGGAALVLSGSALFGRHALVRAGAGTVLSGYAVAASLARPWTTALTLLGVVAVGAVVAWCARSAAVRELAAGTVLGALPGAAGAVAATFEAPGRTAAAVALLVAAFCVTAAALWRRAVEESRPLLSGLTALGALVVALTVFTADPITPAGGVAALLVVCAVFIAPPRQPAADPAAIAAGAGTLAVIAALARLTAILKPGIGLVTSAAAIAVVAVGVGVLPRRLRSGPAVGGAVAAASVGLVAGAGAMFLAARSVLAALPAWRADLGAWSSTVAVDRERFWGAQLPLALLLLGGASLAMLPARWRHHAAVVSVTLASLAAPASLDLPWWSPPAVSGTAGLLLGLGALAGRDPTAALVRAGAGGVLWLYAAGTALARPGTTALTLGGIVAGCALLATLATLRSGHPRHAVIIGGSAVTRAILALPGAAAALTAELGRPVATTLQVTMAAASLGLVAAALLRIVRSPYTPYAVAGVAGAAAGAAVAALPTSQPAGAYLAVAGLLGVGASMLLLPRRRDAAIAVIAGAAAPLAAAALSTVVTLYAVLLQPYAWLTAPWSRVPTSSRDGLHPAPAAAADIDGWSTVTLLLITVAVALTALGLSGWSRVPAAALPGAAAVLVVAPVALDLSWPAAVIAALVACLACGLWAALRRRPGLAAAVSVITGGTAVAGSLATAPTTLTAFGGLTAGGALTGLAGRVPGARTTGWAVTGLGTLSFAFAAGQAADLPRRGIAWWLLVAAVGLLATAATLPRRRRLEQRTLEVWSYLGAGFAVVLAAESARAVALVLAVYGATLGLSALRPGLRRLAHAALACQIAAWWLLLGAEGVVTVEAYTLPVAAVAVLGGVLELRRRPGLHSWLAFGPALAAAFLPSMAAIMTSGGTPTRRLLVGLGGLAVAVAGARTRRQAPLVAGALATGMVAMHELVLLWDLLPRSRWIPIATAGVLLIALGATYERRRRDLRRMRLALRQMR